MDGGGRRQGGHRKSGNAGFFLGKVMRDDLTKKKCFEKKIS